MLKLLHLWPDRLKTKKPKVVISNINILEQRYNRVLNRDNNKYVSTYYEINKLTFIGNKIYGHTKLHYYLIRKNANVVQPSSIKYFYEDEFLIKIPYPNNRTQFYLQTFVTDRHVTQTFRLSKCFVYVYCIIFQDI